MKTSYVVEFVRLFDYHFHYINKWLNLKPQKHSLQNNNKNQTIQWYAFS